MMESAAIAILLVSFNVLVFFKCPIQILRLWCFIMI